MKSADLGAREAVRAGGAGRPDEAEGHGESENGEKDLHSEKSLYEGCRDVGRRSFYIISHKVKSPCGKSLLGKCIFGGEDWIIHPLTTEAERMRKCLKDSSPRGHNRYNPKA